MEKILAVGRSLIPRKIFKILQPLYHYSLAFLAAFFYAFPSHNLCVIAVTGTKGKSSVVELVNSILEEAGFATALVDTIRFKIGGDSRPNFYKMTMPGRFFLQRFLRRAVRAGCTHAIVEMTSEGARQFRHKFISLDALIFTNLAPEHIESHGSYEKYVAAKVALANALERSPLKKGARPNDWVVPVGQALRRNVGGGLSQPPKATPFSKGDKLLVVNGDDKEAQKFLAAFSGTKIRYSKRDAQNALISSNGVAFDWLKPSLIGEGSPEHFVEQNVLGNEVRITSKLPGEFNLYNILAAAAYAKAALIPVEKIKAGIEKVKSIRGRAEEITLQGSERSDLESGKRLDLFGPAKTQDFTVIVDYAHTPDSLEKLYQTFAGKYRICVLGNTGGGRDTWKRAVMGEIAGRYCDEIILTNEDPYDEDPERIIREMAAGMHNNPPGQPPLLRGTKQPTVILDRRAAIRAALAKASRGDVVLITGKGTDPFIMGPRGSKEVWDDATVVREELQSVLVPQNR